MMSRLKMKRSSSGEGNGCSSNRFAHLNSVEILKFVTESQICFTLEREGIIL